MMPVFDQRPRPPSFQSVNAWFVYLLIIASPLKKKGCGRAMEESQIDFARNNERAKPAGVVFSSF